MTWTYNTLDGAFKTVDGEDDRLVDWNGQVWRLMTEDDFEAGRESVVVYTPATFEFKRYTPVR